MKNIALNTISLALTTITALTCAIPADAATKPPARPNIIVIFTDDQTYGAIGYNNPAVKTPHLDALAASGITFERAYVASPICAASRASMMTGLFPQQHGVIALGNGPFSAYRSGAPGARRTLPRRLADAGYVTALFGKSHLGKPTSYGFNTGRELSGHDDVETFKQASLSIHEESVRVPMFAFGPGIPPGRTTRALVSALDVYPTLLDPAGAPAPSQPIMGESLLPLLKNPATEHRDTVFSECVGGKPGEGHRMARGDRWKLILSDTDEEFLL